MISAGTRLGPYEVIAPIGAGGMGEVWKARDTRLERSVAIKVLPAEFADDAQLKLRFEREAKTISQLNHPHICTLYDVGDGYLVMELLEGESLADKLARGPLPLELVIRYGIEIAEALERAHKAGVVHRDLKPGNIMITKTGAKLLDFGLAKPASVFSPEGATQHRSLTQEGSIVGTFQYMAPEQIEGGEIDARTDIFALGTLLYEMATGRHAFDGKSKASLIASILTSEPQSITAMQPMAPALFDRIVRTCLAKDPDQRWQSAHDVATELRWVTESPAIEVARTSKRRQWLPWAIAALALLASIAFGGLIVRMRNERLNEPVLRTSIVPPQNTTFDSLASTAPPVLSPNGRKVVFGASEQGKPRMLWVRPLDSTAAQRVAGTERAFYPFWSPDSRSIGFFADGVLKKVEVAGGAPVTLCPVIDGRGGSWSPDGQTIIFAGRYTPIYRISAAGGSPVAVTKTDVQWGSHRWPEFLPDSRHFLYLSTVNGSDDPSNSIAVGSTDGKLQKRLTGPTLEPHYANGCILFVRDHILTAQRFDLKNLTVLGDGVPLREEPIEAMPLLSRSVVSVSAEGTLLYQTGNAPRQSQLEWFDRGGKPLGAVGEPAPYSSVSIGPGATSVIASYIPGLQTNLWRFDLVRGAKGRVTFNQGSDNAGAWSPDGTKMAYTSINSNRFRIVVRDLTSGSEDVLYEAASVGNPNVSSWSSDGKRLLFTMAGRTSRADIWWIELDERKPHPYLVTDFVETGAHFSPDGRWVAYASDEAGRQEVYLAPFPPTGAKWQVSTEGGAGPRFRADGKEMFFACPATSKMMMVPIMLGNTPQIGAAVPLFDFHPAVSTPANFDVTGDGQRFLCNTRIGDEVPAAPLTLVQHFDRELREAFGQRQ